MLKECQMPETGSREAVKVSKHSSSGASVPRLVISLFVDRFPFHIQQRQPAPSQSTFTTSNQERALLREDGEVQEWEDGDR